MNTKSISANIFDSAITRTAIVDSFRKLNPRVQFRNPVMFIVEVGAILSTYGFIRDLWGHQHFGFDLHITIWLWFTVLFANFAEAVAEGRGKAQAASLRQSVTGLVARKIKMYPEDRAVSRNDLAVAKVFADPARFTEEIPATGLNKGDYVFCKAGDTIPGDGEVVDGIASVDESAITGESAPVIRESGGDRSAVTGGTRILSDGIIIHITSERGNTFLDRMIALVEGAVRRKTPNEIALSILLASLSLVFLLAVATLPAFALYVEKTTGQMGAILLTLPVLVSLLVCLIPTTIGGLLSAIGISGMNRLLRHNVIATSGRAIEAAGDVDVLLLDKTGTITVGNRMATEFIPAPGVTIERLADAAQLASLSDETPEGRSIVVLAKNQYNLRSREVSALQARFIPFSAATRMSGADLPDPVTGKMRCIRKGSAEAILNFILENDGTHPIAIFNIVEKIASEGGTPLVVAENNFALGVIRLKDVVKGGIRERFAQLRSMGIKTVMITGDNPVTAAAIAAEAGVDDFIAEATPESKLARIKEEQQRGRLIAMIGDGTNDAPALAQADVGVAMNTGTQAAREAGNMIDLDSNPTKLIEIVEIGKQLLMTRGSLTTFSIANDVSKYFAILPAMLGGLYATSAIPGPLSVLNIMGLASPQSAILSAVIFNALIIIALVPLSLKGIRYKPSSARRILLKNIFVYGVGGLIIPFIGIKLIDMLLVVAGLS
ncbi:MAG: potassium-transporting ATPase subunit KdpB [Chitinivibrionales bacterium]|nr:potassium-transporting ATPase subunit KdpB [Chitinivibrionales bacterium]